MPSYKMRTRFPSHVPRNFPSLNPVPLRLSVYHFCAVIQSLKKNVLFLTPFNLNKMKIETSKHSIYQLTPSKVVHLLSIFRLLF